MIPGLKELIEKNYQLQNELEKAGNHMDANLKAEIENDYLRQYKIERDELFRAEELKRLRAEEEQKLIYAMLTPRRWRKLGFLWRKKNYAARALEAEAYEKVEAFFNGELTIDELFGKAQAQGEAPRAEDPNGNAETHTEKAAAPAQPERAQATDPPAQGATPDKPKPGTSGGTDKAVAARGPDKAETPGTPQGKA